MQLNIGFRLPREVVSVPVVRHLVRTTLSELRVEEDCAADVLLALSEACSNVIEHSSEVEDEYEIRLDVSGPRAEIRVIDRGRGFDYAALVEGMPEGSEERGRGIQLMRALVDRISFESRPERGTIVHFEKALALGRDSPLHLLSAPHSAE